LADGALAWRQGLEASQQTLSEVRGKVKRHLAAMEDEWFISIDTMDGYHYGWMDTMDIWLISMVNG
jgi:hypothetical protein